MAKMGWQGQSKGQKILAMGVFLIAAVFVHMVKRGGIRHQFFVEISTESKQWETVWVRSRISGSTLASIEKLEIKRSIPKRLSLMLPRYPGDKMQLEILGKGKQIMVVPVHGVKPNDVLRIQWK